MSTPLACPAASARRRVIAAQHRDVADAGRAQLGDRRPARASSARRRASPGRSPAPSRATSTTCRPCAVGRGDARLERAGQPAARRRSGAASRARRATPPTSRGDAEAGHRLHRHRLERRRSPACRACAAIARSTGCGERAATRGRRRQHRRSARRRRRPTTSTTLRTPCVSVPVLSTATAANRREPLEVQAALDQHAVARRRGQRRDDRDRRAQHERARAGDDQQHQRAIERSRRAASPNASGGTIATSAASTSTAGV